MRRSDHREECDWGGSHGLIGLSTRARLLFVFPLLLATQAAALSQTSEAIKSTKEWDTFQRSNAETAAKLLADTCGAKAVVEKDEVSGGPYGLRIVMSGTTDAQLECAITVSGRTGIYIQLHPKNGGSNVKELRSLDAAQAKRAELAADRVRQCGLAGAHPEHGEYMVWVQVDAKSASKEQLSCAAKVEIATGIEVSFPAKTVASSSYDRTRADLENAVMVYRQKTELARRGVLSRLPKYHYGRSNDRAFARSLERLCGSKAHGAFRRGTKADGETRAGLLFWDGRKIDKATSNCLDAAAELSGFPHGVPYE